MRVTSSGCRRVSRVLLAALLAPMLLALWAAPARAEDTAPTSTVDPMDYAAESYTCGGLPFGPDVLFKPADAEDGTDGPSRALRREIEKGWIEPETGWIRAAETKRRVEFLNDIRDLKWDFPFQSETFARNKQGRWTWRYGGNCRPNMVVQGYGEAEWKLDGNRPPLTDSSKIHILVTELGCSSGQSVPPEDIHVELIETDEAVAIGVVAKSSTGWQTCPGERPTPYVVELQSDLGERELINNAVFPPKIAQAGADRYSRAELLASRQAACDATSSLMESWSADSDSDTGSWSTEDLEDLMLQTESTSEAYKETTGSVFRDDGLRMLFHARRILRGAQGGNPEIMMANGTDTWGHGLNRLARDLESYCEGIERPFAIWDINPRHFIRPGHQYPVIADDYPIVDGTGRGWDCDWTKRPDELPDGKGICANGSSFEGATITGRVYSKRSLEPVVGARVVLRISHEFSRELLVAKSNRYGEFSFHALAAPYRRSAGMNCGRIRVYAEGFGVHTLKVGVTYNERKVVGIGLGRENSNRDIIPDGTRCRDMWHSG